MFPLSVVSLSADEWLQKYEEFDKAFGYFLEDGSHYFEPHSFYDKSQFYYDFTAYIKEISENPLLSALFVVILVVLAFHLLPLIIHSFRR